MSHLIQQRRVSTWWITCCFNLSLCFFRQRNLHLHLPPNIEASHDTSMIYSHRFSVGESIRSCFVCAVLTSSMLGMWLITKSPKALHGYSLLMPEKLHFFTLRWKIWNMERVSWSSLTIPVYSKTKDLIEWHAVDTQDMLCTGA